MYQTTEPARYWQDQLILWGPKILFAILILVVTHFVAKAVQWGVAKLIDRMPVLKRHPSVGGDSIGTELGRLAYWLVWLVGLIAALQPLGLSGVLAPVSTMLNEVATFIPRLFGAGLFFFAGLILARIVRHVIEAALGAINLEQLAGRAGLRLSETPVAVDAEGTASEGVSPTRSTIARAVGMTVSAVIIIFAAIASLDILHIEAVSEPAKNMLNMIALAIPNVLAALLWLAIAFLIARWVKTLIETVLPSLGFDNFIHSLGAMPRNVSPSRVAGAIAMTALLLLAGIEALHRLGGDDTAALVIQVTELGGKVIFGTVIIVVGFVLARILAGLVGASTERTSYAEVIVKYAIIALFTAIGLTFMGLADQIVMLAFGLILGSAAVATAIAFGLGGRDYAARLLEEWHESNSPPAVRRPPPPRLKKATAEDDSQPPLV
ncbi:mechanosensitive ion channel [Sphingomonas sp. G124]|uniref:Small-conductance mechanosensitive channel n=1 Tax=Sphingomonas cremea TaxID=2904799 RepID=A0A9X1TZN0_9SPHN|nr:mechanosensitive ion channel [Sphingomonas cremea]MCF2515992.1 mechanosensitive ion channel [Sphingomonas cremea]